MIGESKHRFQVVSNKDVAAAYSTHRRDSESDTEETTPSPSTAALVRNLMQSGGRRTSRRCKAEEFRTDFR